MSEASRAAGEAFGTSVFNTYKTWRNTDGATGSVPYNVVNAPGHWSPDPMNPGQNAWGPGWGTVKTFSLPTSTHFSVPGVLLNSPEYTAAYNELVNFGGLTSSMRTDDQTNIGLFGPTIEKEWDHHRCCTARTLRILLDRWEIRKTRTPGSLQ